MAHKNFSLEDQEILGQLMFHRRDVCGNNFLSDPVSSEAIQKILNAAVLAPSVGLSQPWEFVVVRDARVKQQIFESFEIENTKAEEAFDAQRKEQYRSLKLEGIIEAPVNIAVFYKPSMEPVLGQTSMVEVGEYSVVCAIQNMWLMSRAMNIGLGWVSIIDPQRVKQILMAPPENKLIAYLCIGYVKEFYDEPEFQKLNWDRRRGANSSTYYDTYKKGPQAPSLLD